MSQLLEVLHGLEHFHQDTYGRNVIIQTYHKPLQNILKRSLHETPKWLLRMLLRLQLYDINLIYPSGKQMDPADTLSRTPFSDNIAINVEREIAGINILQFLPMSKPGLSSVRVHTSNDATLRACIHHMYSNRMVNKS